MGGRARVAGSPSRMIAVGCKRRRSTTALVKWVVPIMMPVTAEGSAPLDLSRNWRAVVIPAVTSAVVGVLILATTCEPLIKTASVLVPPTSIPMRT